MLSTCDSIQLSASDLVGHLYCRHLTSLNLAVAKGLLPKPQLRDPMLDVLRERGARHEREYVDHLASDANSVTLIEGIHVDGAAVRDTISAIRAGADVIVQAALVSDGWGGRIDVLRKIGTPSQLGPWSYEVIDTKLARATKSGTVLQLCLYSELVAAVQGFMPEYTYVVAPWTNYEAQAFRIADHAAYYRKVKDSLNDAVGSDARNEYYPAPTEHCDVCRWRINCEKRRRNDDHLSLVAGISKLQIAELEQRDDAQTVAKLGELPLPLTWKPDRGTKEAYKRVREQARIQVEGRTAGKVIYEPLSVVEGFGISRLPQPSTGDIYFDLEGDPFVGEAGLEYLFGYSFHAQDGSLTHVADWAFSRADEKAAFERFVDFVNERLQRFPDLHIYHYAPYEPSALKRLMGRYATREDEVDGMLRAKLFVDLYAVVRHGVRASVESYSIKRLEPLYGFARKADLPSANLALANVQACLELGELEGLSASDRLMVQAYNRDDCVSTCCLRDWLEEVRSTLIAEGQVITRPPVETGDAGEALSAWQEKIAALANRIAGNVPVDTELRNPEQSARSLLANILDWHRRENKAILWERFRLADLSAEDLLDERAAVSRLVPMGQVGGTAKCPIHRYSFPAQETELRGGEELRVLGGEKFGKVQAINREERWIDIKKRGDSADTDPEGVFAHTLVDTDVLADALVRLGEHVVAHGIMGEGPYTAARDLLLRIPPNVSNEPLRIPGETSLSSALRVAPKLVHGILPIQGPPGSGKTYTGARMICALVSAGLKVGVTANSHKVVRNLLDCVCDAADELGVSLTCMQKVKEKEPDAGRLRFTTDNAELLSAIGTSCQVAGGTAWLWAHPDAFQSVDVLFVDEAAQMSLANVLASSQAANRIVLLGDPQQLDQPTKGSHPEGTDVSSLHHLLDGHQTIPADRGLFLEETWRLHPQICAFTSELFYEGRLHPRAGLNVQSVRSTGRVNGAGLRYLPVVHAGNQSSCREEADAVRDLVCDLIDRNANWTDRDGVERRITLDDILIISPYNAQVFELQERLPPGAKIGTVDKFQGQEAAIVIYSVTTSSHADAPRGMEFLYSPNRLNVATSRAKCVCILVASPAIFEAACRTPRQMQLVNAFCRYLELATKI